MRPGHQVSFYRVAHHRCLGRDLSLQFESGLAKTKPGLMHLGLKVQYIGMVAGSRGRPLTFPRRDRSKRGHDPTVVRPEKENAKDIPVRPSKSVLGRNL